MKIRHFVVPAILGCCLVACDKTKTVDARIYERKHLDGNQLQIKYKYTIDEKAYTDSAVVENKVIPDDVMNITVDKSDPTQTIYTPKN